MSDTLRVSNVIAASVGVGTASPVCVLEIYGNSSNYNVGLFQVVNANATPNAIGSFLAPNMSAATNALVNIGAALATNNAFGLGFNYVSTGSTSNFLQISPYGSSTGLNIQATGNVGIGITNPSAPLHIVSQSLTWVNMATFYSPNITTQGCLIVLGKASSSYNNLSIQYNHISDGSTNNFGCLQISGVGNIMNWTGLGYIGIGVTNPTQILDIATGPIQLRNGNDNATFTKAQLIFGYNGTTSYSHAIVTRHQAGNINNQNAIDFLTWQYGLQA